MIPLENIFLVYSMHDKDGELQHRLIGKICVDGKNVQVLEDHIGLLNSLELNPDSLKSLKNSSHITLASLDDIINGRRFDLIDEDIPPESDKMTNIEAKEPVFDYFRQGLEKPQLFEFKQGKAYLNGNELNDSEVTHIMSNVQHGIATIRYHNKPQEPMVKSEQDSTDYLLSDHMVPAMGNGASFKQFSAQNNPGVHLSVDFDSLNAIRSKYGHNLGDKTTKAAGEAIINAIRASVGKRAKSWHVADNRFHIHVPTYQDAAKLSRALRENLEKIPNIGGTFKMSASIGLGHTINHAEAASEEAKSGKNMVNYPINQSKTHIHSLVPGKEGAIPV